MSATTVFGTDGRAAALTHKQADCIMFVYFSCDPEYWVTNRGAYIKDIALSLEQNRVWDLEQSSRPKYWGTSVEAIRPTLNTLAARGFLAYDESTGLWTCTSKGTEAGLAMEGC